jgi:putative chitinase
MTLAITAEHLAQIAGRKTALMPALAEWMNQLCPQYQIDTAQEYAHFLAQACHETDHFKTLREYASGSAYEGRADLGNTQAGDGVRFRGRGIFQTTGRANYLQLGIKKGSRDLFINKPELLEEPEMAVWSACEYWLTRNLNDAANHPDSDRLKKKYKGAVLDLSPVEFISYTVNGGNRGLEDRKAFYAKALAILSEAEAGSREMPASAARAGLAAAGKSMSKSNKAKSSKAKAEKAEKAEKASKPKKTDAKAAAKAAPRPVSNKAKKPKAAVRTVKAKAKAKN